MGDKQHDPDRNRIFVRALEGKYSLKEELGRLRAMPRVIKGKDLKPGKTIEELQDAPK